MGRALAACLMLLLGACAVPVPPAAQLPADATEGAGDAARAAILGSAPAFAAPPQRVADALHAAARAVRQDEAAAAERARQAIPISGETPLLRRSGLAPLPRARLASALARRELIRADRDSCLGGVGSHDGGRD